MQVLNFIKKKKMELKNSMPEHFVSAKQIGYKKVKTYNKLLKN
jgi:hypothetical protein